MPILAGFGSLVEHKNQETPMSLSRRGILKALLGGALALGATTAQSRATQGLFGGKDTFAAFLDTLIPEDGMSPNASTLDIPAAVLAQAEGKTYARLIEAGCLWLDGRAQDQHGLGFAALTPAQRIPIVQRADQAPRGSVENVFFRAVLDDAMERYYADPRAWSGLGFQGPPQPVGFPDFMLAPSP